MEKGLEAIKQTEELYSSVCLAYILTALHNNILFNQGFVFVAKFSVVDQLGNFASILSLDLLHCTHGLDSIF